MTVYRLQNFEPPPDAADAPTLPPQIQQWITAGASLLPPALLPPGLIPGTAPAAPPAPDAQRFHGFRILEWQPVKDPSIKGDIVDLFGRGSNFQNAPPSCMYAEFGFAIAQPDAPTPADILVSLSCEQVEVFNFPWPYTRPACRRIRRRSSPRSRSAFSKHGEEFVCASPQRASVGTVVVEQPVDEVLDVALVLNRIENAGEPVSLVCRTN
jgi:hypothetical protein